METGSSESIRIEQFVDWARLTDREIQATLRETLTQDLAIALMGDDVASRQVEERILQNVSERVQGILRQFMSDLSPDEHEVEEARQKILKTIQALQANGVIHPPT